MVPESSKERQFMYKNIINAINKELNDIIPHNDILKQKHKLSIITRIEGLTPNSEEVVITLKNLNGKQNIIKLYHEQDCCERVTVDQVDNKVERHIGATIYAIREKISNNVLSSEDWDDSNTWTFYDIETSKGRLSFRWHGASNGYYSESVDIEQ